MKIISKLALVLTVSILVACGSVTKQESVGVEAPTRLILKGKSLVGLEVAVGEGFSRNISRADLTPFVGVAGAADGQDEKLERVNIRVDPGEHRVIVRKAGAVLLSKVLYFGTGQTRELRIDQ